MSMRGGGPKSARLMYSPRASDRKSRKNTVGGGGPGEAMSNQMKPESPIKISPRPTLPPNIHASRTEYSSG